MVSGILTFFNKNKAGGQAVQTDKTVWHCVHGVRYNIF